MPQQLTKEQKRGRVEWCFHMLQKFDGARSERVWDIVTGDESFVSQYDRKGPCSLLWSCALRVHDSQAYRKMDVKRERISCILELREILLSFQTSFSLVNAVVACAILESISGFEPSSVITKPRYLKLVTVSSFYPFTLISVLMSQLLFVISLVFSAVISMP